MQTRQILDVDNVKYHDEFRGPGNVILGDRDSLQVYCEFGSSGSKLKRKIERAGYGEEEREDVYQYTYDRDGHLLEVTHNHLPAEKYWYNDWGQRFCRETWPGGACDYWVYQKDDSLKAAGRELFEFDRRGNTVSRKQGNAKTLYNYQRGVLLERAILSDGLVVSYVYGKEIPPLKRYLNGRLAAEYAWQPAKNGAFLLRICRDYVQGFDFYFGYADRLCPQTLSIRKISDRADVVWKKIHKGRGEKIDMFCGCDQVGSLKRLADAMGNEIKYTNFDSFGNVLEETLPELRLPLGFASGLWDRETGLIRFGCRDYDPFLGRFLCPDPLGDTDGDHDPYDYCVDVPVGSFDPNGLWAHTVIDDYRGRQKENQTQLKNKVQPKADMADKSSINKPRVITAKDRIRGWGTGALDILTVVPGAMDITADVIGADEYGKSIRYFKEVEKEKKSKR